MMRPFRPLRVWITLGATDDRAILVHKREDGNDGRDCSVVVISRARKEKKSEFDVGG